MGRNEAAGEDLDIPIIVTAVAALTKGLRGHPGANGACE